MTPHPPARGIEKLWAEAVQYHNEGRLADAEARYREILTADPQHVDGLYLLGILADQTGRQAEAADLINKAISLAPTNPFYHYGLGNILLGQGNPAEAIVHYDRAIALRPDFAEAHGNLGSAHKDLGHLSAAVVHFERAAALKPHLPEIQNNLGDALRKQGKLAEARKCLERAVALNPDYAEALINLGSTLTDGGEPAAAIPYYERALGIKPDSAEAHNNLGHALQKLSRPADAMEHYRHALALRPGYAEAHNNLGNVLNDLRQPREAMKHYERALTLQPDLAEAHGNLGNLLLDLGRFDEAQREYETAIALAPGVIRHYRALMTMKRMTSDDRHRAALESLARDMCSLPVSEQTELHFALGKAHADIGRHERSFRHLIEGNSLKRRSIVYDEARTLGLFDRIRSSFNSDLINSATGLGHPSSVPIFIVGMMRSGTSLMEQMLAGHPNVFGAGETREFPKLVESLLPNAFPELIPLLSRSDLRHVGKNYLDSIAARSTGKQRVTDKLPGNFVFAGLIHMALPNARIIHMRRDPIDTCLSCFSLLFTDDHPYSYDLAELGRYYQAYVTLMEHWRQVLPAGVMLDVHYEDLVASVEPQLRQVLAHCGLTWDNACLDFHKLDRPVRTASAFQVRQPIYRTSIGRWRPYEQLLQPLIKELGLVETNRA